MVKNHGLCTFICTGYMFHFQMLSMVIALQLNARSVCSKEKVLYLTLAWSLLCLMFKDDDNKVVI